MHDSCAMCMTLVPCGFGSAGTWGLCSTVIQQRSDGAAGPAQNLSAMLLCVAFPFREKHQEG